MRNLLVYVFALLAAVGDPLSASGERESGDYYPTMTPPPNDPIHFKEKTDLKIWTDTFNSLAQVAEKKKIGLDIAQKFSKLGSDGQVPHPWSNGNPNSYLDYFLDMISALNTNKFMDCFEPWISLNPDYYQICAERCPINPYAYTCLFNVPIVIEYWWPESQVEINNFGISAFNPALGNRTDLTRAQLISALQDLYDEEKQKHGSKFPSQLPFTEPDIGQSHWDGLLPGTQEWAGEAHAYLTALTMYAQKFRPKSTEGFFYSYTCFLDSLLPTGADENNDAEQIHGWTEDPDLLPYWRSEAASQYLDESLYKASVPPTSLDLEDLKSYLDDREKSLAFLQEKTCASYRLATWPDRYGKGYADLESALGVVKNTSSELGRICYFGGGQLFPVTGKLTGNFSPLVAAAYLTRRAIYLMSLDKMEQAMGERTRMAIFSDEIDKLQRIYPRKGKTEGSGCFRMDDVDEYSNEQESEFTGQPGESSGKSLGNPRFPKDLVRPEDMGSIRYVYWNKRATCMCPCYSGDDSTTGCSSVDNGDSEDTPKPIGLKLPSLPFGVPFPFALGGGSS